MTFLQIAIMAAISLLVTAWLSWRGDDDAVYRLKNRKPTQQETAAHGRFVISKTLTTVSCGSASAIVINDVFGLSLSENGKLFIIMVCVGFFFFAVGEGQNVIRRMQNREQRPALDISTLRDKLDIWRGKK